jgi:hypothetical protein
MTLPGGVFNGTMIPYAPASLDNTLPGYSLTRRINDTDPRVPIPAERLEVRRLQHRREPIPRHGRWQQDLREGRLRSAVPVRAGLRGQGPEGHGRGPGRAARHGELLPQVNADASGTANPLAGRITSVIGQGTSQSGNAMKTFLHLGFNQALDGGKVFDGLYAHVAARQTNVNTRFAVPGGGGAIRTDHTAFGQTAPRALDKDYVDPLTGRKGGVMTRCAATSTCPKFFLGLSGTEFWQLQGSPVLTNAAGTADLAQPDNARIYYYSSTQHGGNGGTAGIGYNPAANVYPTGTTWPTTPTPSARCSSRSKTGW